MLLIVPTSREGLSCLVEPWREDSPELGLAGRKPEQTVAQKINNKDSTCLSLALSRGKKALSLAST